LFESSGVNPNLITWDHQSRHEVVFAQDVLNNFSTSFVGPCCQHGCMRRELSEMKPLVRYSSAKDLAQLKGNGFEERQVRDVNLQRHLSNCEAKVWPAKGLRTSNQALEEMLSSSQLLMTCR